MSAQGPCKDGNVQGEPKAVQEKLERFFSALQKAVANDDRPAARLVSYPLNVSLETRKLKIVDQAAFIRDYDEMFPPEIRKFLAAQRSTCISRVGAQGFSAGQGQFWFDVFPDGEVKLFGMTPIGYDDAAVNPP